MPTGYMHAELGKACKSVGFGQAESRWSVGMRGVQALYPDAEPTRATPEPRPGIVYITSAHPFLFSFETIASPFVLLVTRHCRPLCPILLVGFFSWFSIGGFCMPAADYRCDECLRVEEVSVGVCEVLPEWYFCQADNVCDGTMRRVWSSPYIASVSGAGGSPGRSPFNG